MDENRSPKNRTKTGMKSIRWRGTWWVTISSFGEFGVPSYRLAQSSSVLGFVEWHCDGGESGFRVSYSSWAIQLTHPFDERKQNVAQM
jgi:hypothetical protein